MPDAPTAYPLQWPTGVPRTPESKRVPGKFHTSELRYGESSPRRRAKDLSVAAALSRLQREIERIGARLPVLSTNVELRIDGLPYSNRRAPDDPGACLYFQLRDKPIALPCDRYTKVEANIAAIAKHIEATRAIERYGVASVEQMFRGFEALPPPKQSDWRAVLGFRSEERPTRDDIQRRRRELAALHHPDAGGDATRMAEINAAADAAMLEIANV